MSKNHYGTILLLIKEYSFDKDDIELIEELSISQDDAKFYTSLKKDRHNASYSTFTLFNKEMIENYERKVVDFIVKVEEIIEVGYFV